MAWKYLRYILSYKWQVLCECLRVGIVWRGLIHDLEVFYPRQYQAFAWKSFGVPLPLLEADRLHASGKPVPKWNERYVRERFLEAWRKHLRRTDHHWESWVIFGEERRLTLLPMPMDAVYELVASWAAKAKMITGDRANAIGFWRENYTRFRLHGKTIARIEWVLGIETYATVKNTIAFREQSRLLTLDKEGRGLPQLFKGGF